MIKDHIIRSKNINNRLNTGSYYTTVLVPLFISGIRSGLLKCTVDFLQASNTILSTHNCTSRTISSNNVSTNSSLLTLAEPPRSSFNCPRGYNTRKIAQFTVIHLKIRTIYSQTSLSGYRLSGIACLVPFGHNVKEAYNTWTSGHSA